MQLFSCQYQQKEPLPLLAGEALEFLKARYGLLHRKLSSAKHE